VLVGLILTPINCYWIMESDIVHYVGFSTTVSLFYNVIFSLILLLTFNAGLRRWFPKWRLRQTEMLTVYVMLAISSALCGHDQVQVLISMMAYPVQYASTSNNWDTLFLHKMPRWLIVTDKPALHDFFGGHTSLYTVEHLRAWMLPSLVDQNPLVWMAEVNGVLVDLRDMPRELQVIAYEKGMIPYVPADKE